MVCENEEHSRVNIGQILKEQFLEGYYHFPLPPLICDVVTEFSRLCKEKINFKKLDEDVILVESCVAAVCIITCSLLVECSPSHFNCFK